jgi:hypothetical protein
VNIVGALPRQSAPTSGRWARCRAGRWLEAADHAAQGVEVGDDRAGRLRSRPAQGGADGAAAGEFVGNAERFERPAA